MKLFKKAYKLLKEHAVMVESQKKDDITLRVVGDTDNYFVRIYLKVARWLTQCGCEVGISSKPTGLCKHHIAAIVKIFLEVNNLKLVEVEHE